MQNPLGRRVNGLALAPIDAVAAAVHSDEPEVEGVIFCVFHHLEVGPDLPRVGGFAVKHVIEDDFPAQNESVFHIVGGQVRAGNQDVVSGRDADGFQLVWRGGRKGKR